MRVAAFASLLIVLSKAALAGPPLLILPVDCTLGEDCYVQNYVDRDPGPDYSDFSCGKLSYDGHKGTDFALHNHRAGLAGVDVLAAAPGRVKALRDRLPDHFMGAAPVSPAGQECGNGVVISHDDGWETQYCHLARGSIRVTVGEQVAAGKVLGRIGMSGRTEFPHLHLSLRWNGAVIDPFDPVPDETCGAPAEDQLWQRPLAYTAGGLLQAGFSFAIPEFGPVKFGTAHDPRLPAGADALVLWAHLFGTRDGDSLQMRITGPNDEVFHEQVVDFDKPQAQAMRATGRRLHTDNTVPGAYRGEVVLMRSGQAVGHASTSTLLQR